MKQLSINIHDINELSEILGSYEIRESAKSAVSTLIHIYTAVTSEVWLQSIAQEIERHYPSAHIIGVTTCGEIFNGDTVVNQTIVNFSFFTSTQIHPFVMPIKAGDELETGQYLRRCIDELGDAVPAIMLLTTPLTTNANALARGLMMSPPSFQIFGGGSGDYALETNYIMYGSTVYAAGVIVVVFQGSDLQVLKTNFLGWSPMSNEMTITKASGTTIHTINGIPAFEVYQHYFNIQNDTQFFSNAIGFPFLINRSDQLIALVPVAVGLDNSLEFISDVFEGEIVSIGFFNAELIQENLRDASNALLAFQPQSILVYSCGCRRWALRDDIKSETSLFQMIAPTAGFYTVGEFCNQDAQLFQLNLAFVVVGMREGPALGALNRSLNKLAYKEAINDVYSSSHVKVINRLSHFSKRLRDELLSAQDDINERIKKDAYLLEAKELAEQLSKSKSQFLANMSHEIRTPMTAIIGFSELALSEDLSADARDYIETINRASTSLLVILNDILDLSKLEASRLIINAKCFKLDDMLSSVHDLLINVAKSKHLTLSIFNDIKVPAQLIGDSLRLRQVLVNLLGNAIKFTEQGSVTLTINVQHIDVHAVRLLFSVKDTGIGIDPQLQHKLFSPFSQLDDSYSRHFQGTGLGLVISQELVQLMGGVIELESTLGLGSCFSFELLLPIMPSIEHQSIKSLALDAPILTNTVQAELEGLTILVVEDEPLNQKLVNLVVTNNGANCIIASNGREALTLLGHQPIHAVLMDLHMPIMNGFEATAEIRKLSQFASLPIIALTASVSEETSQKCLATGMNDFIDKPLNIIELVSKLKYWTSYT